MAKNKQGKGGGARKIGTQKEKCLRYTQRGTRTKHKLKHITRSNGPKAVRSWNDNPRAPFPPEE